MLSVRDIWFEYRAPVLKGVSFEVSAGEMLAVLGPNGSGKSTLMNIIARILTPKSGELSLDGCNVRSLTRVETARAIGYVPQQSDVRFPLTAMEYVLQGRFAQGRLIGFETEEDLEAAEWA